MVEVVAEKKKEEKHLPEQPLKEDISKKQQLPKIAASISQIKNRLWSGCPDAVRETLAREILKSNETVKLKPAAIKEKINEINAALKEIYKVDKRIFVDYLGREPISKCFVTHPNEFAEIVKITEEYPYPFFFALLNEHVNRLFLKRPNDFVRLAEATDRTLAGSIFYPLEQNERVRQLFEKYPDEIIEVAKVTKISANYALEVLGNEYTNKAFVERPTVIIEALGRIVKASEGDAVMALCSLSDNKDIDRVFAENPKEFAEMAEGAREATWTAIDLLEKHKKLVKIVLEHPHLFKKFGELVRSGGEDVGRILENERCAKMFETHPDLVSYAVYGLERGINGLSGLYFDEDYDRFTSDLRKVNFLENDERAKFYFRFCYSRYYSYSLFPTFLSKVFPSIFAGSVMKKLDTLNKKFGIEFFERYDDKTIDYLYRIALSPNYQRKKPTVLVILNKNDSKRAFERPDLYGSLLKGYRMVIVEVDDDTEALERLKSVAKTYGKLDLLLIGGHGTISDLNLGKEGNEEAGIDISDFEQYGGAGGLEKYLNKDAKVVLESCSTGKGGQVYKDLGNLMGMMGILTNRKVFAPNIDTSIRRFIFDSKDKVVNVEWAEPKAGERYEAENQPR